MINGIAYITLDTALDIQKKTIENSGGGFDGVINVNQLSYILEIIQNDDYYETFIDKLTHLMFSICKSHCFCDGNKRMSLSLGLYFLNCNGYVLVCREFLPKMEHTIIKLAKGLIDKDFLKLYLSNLIEDKIDDTLLNLMKSSDDIKFISDYMKILEEDDKPDEEMKLRIIDILSKSMCEQ